MKVLVVEDDLAQAFDIMELIEAGGHVPIGPAFDLTAALHFARRDKPDFALVDLNLSYGETGDLVARELHEQLAIPIMFLTGHCESARDHRESAMGCIAKPISGTALLLSIDIAARLAMGQVPTDLPPNVELYV